MKLLLLLIIYAVALSVALARAGRRLQAGFPSGTPGKRPSRLLVIGASGGTGCQLVSQALERGHDVTALVRRPSKFSITHPRLQVVRGDVLDYSAVEKAVAGQDASACTSPFLSFR